MFTGAVKGFKIGDLDKAGVTRHTRIMQQHAVKAGIRIIVRAEKPIDALKSEAINSATASLVNKTADIAKEEGYGTAFKAGMHGLAGTANSLMQGGSAGQGFMAGLTTELVSQTPAGEQFAAPITATVSMLMGGTEEDIARAASISSTIITYNHKLHKEKPADAPDEGEAEEEEVNVLNIKTLGDKGIDKIQAEAKISKLGDDELRVRGEELAGTMRGTIFKSLMTPEEKALLSEYNKRFRPGYGAENVALISDIVPPTTKDLVNKFLPEEQRFAIDSAEMVPSASTAHMGRLPARKMGVAGPASTTKTTGVPVSSGVKLEPRKPVEVATADAARFVVQRDKTGKITGVKFTQKHHVIHQQLAGHPLFRKAGMDVEARVNKMILPTTKGSKFTTTHRSVHQGRHVNTVKDSIEVQMDKALEQGAREKWTQTQYKQELESIIRDERSVLKKGSRQLNKAADWRQ